MSAERERLDRGLSHAAWGYFFLHIHFKLNTVDVLPAFVGGLLLLSAISKLSGERRDLRLLRPLAALLAAWHGLDWLLSWAGMGVDGHILSLDLLITAANLYFHFQFLTDMAALAEQYQPEGDDLDRRLCRRRTVYVVLDTAIALVTDLPGGLLGDWQYWTALGVVAAAFGAALFVMTGLFGLRRCFREERSGT